MKKNKKQKLTVATMKLHSLLPTQWVLHMYGTVSKEGEFRADPANAVVTDLDGNDIGIDAQRVSFHSNISALRSAGLIMGVHDGIDRKIGKAHVQSLFFTFPVPVTS